ncbi:hypothetical protein HHK36_006879 [Tetracentron sinense]|uniref:F-box domain-containing protein n=1 Tax=Tetracentron sinense TaxID=13715 RepID=A0A834ZHY9_TETSI|nr:hypothetical protein HHK36_006879 [Tetracentron sinense]
MEMLIDPRSDMISNLPDHVIETILVHLPIRDAIRTCVLSHKWRYKWATIPELVFEDYSIPPPFFDQNTILTAQDVTIHVHKLVNFIDRVLLLHRGPVLKFKFKLSRYVVSDSCIDAWILFLSRNGVKELTLTIHYERLYKVSYAFFLCQAITCLKLYFCILEPPSMFKGFGDLKSLDLQSVSLSDEVLDTLISNCIALERLSLVQLRGCTRLKICGLNLQHFYFDGELTDICIIDAPQLSFVSIFSHDSLFKHVEQGDSCNLIKVLGPLTGLEKLATECFFLQFLAIGNLPARLPVTYDRLKCISLVINFDDLNETWSCYACSKAPLIYRNLRLCVDATDDKYDVTELVEDFWQAQDHLDCSMNHLRVVRVCNISGAQPELQFMKFLLVNSPLLEILTITPKLDIIIDETKMMKELLRFRRTSAIAEIVYTPNLEDYMF